MSTMCKDCREVIKAETIYLLNILCTPNVSKRVIDITNGVLESALIDLYSEDEDEDITTTYDYENGTVTTSNDGDTMTVISMDDLFNKNKEQ